MKLSLKNKTAIVTGGGRGIGKAIALTFAREGANIVVISRTKSEIDAVAEQAREMGRSALAITADVTKKDQIQAMTRQTLDTFGRIDILVNNAGTAIHNPVIDLREEDWDLTMAINLKGVFLCSQAVIGTMMEQKSGYIINISSMAGKHGSKKYAAYSTSKFGLMGFTECLAAEGKPYNIKVTAICPGPVDTTLRAKNHPDDDRDKLMKSQDIADMALFLVTQPDRAYISEVGVRMFP